MALGQLLDGQWPGCLGRIVEGAGGYSTGTWRGVVGGGHGITESWPFGFSFDDLVMASVHAFVCACVCLGSSRARGWHFFACSLCSLMNMLGGLWLLFSPLTIESLLGSGSRQGGALRLFTPRPACLLCLVETPGGGGGKGGE